jgi:hypothetical protein
MRRGKPIRPITSTLRGKSSCAFTVGALSGLLRPSDGTSCQQTSNRKWRTSRTVCVRSVRIISTHRAKGRRHQWHVRRVTVVNRRCHKFALLLRLFSASISVIGFFNNYLSSLCRIDHFSSADCGTIYNMKAENRPQIGPMSMNNLKIQVFKTRLFLIVAFLALVALALSFHRLIR